METYEDCRYGTFLCPPDTFIGRALEAYGEYSQFEADLLCSLLKPGDIVFEAGAHVGTLTVPLARAADRQPRSPDRATPRRPAIRSPAEGLP